MSRKSIPQSIRKTVYSKYGGRCAYCGCKMEYNDMRVDHVVSVYRNDYCTPYDSENRMNDEDLNGMENLMPSCGMCNFYKSTYGIDEFRERIQTITDRLEKTFIYRLAKKYGIVEEHNKHIQFYFEKEDKSNDKISC